MVKRGKHLTNSLSFLKITLVSILLLNMGVVVYASENYTNVTFASYIANKHIEFHYKWHTIGGVPLTFSAPLENPGFGDFVQTLMIFDTNYDLCGELSHSAFCGYLKDSANSDDLSDYYLLFWLENEFDNITYSEAPGQSNVFSFGKEDIFVDFLDYRNASINFCDPDQKDGDFCGKNNCQLGYNLSKEGLNWNSRQWDAVTKECCGDDYKRNGVVRPDFLYGHVDDPDFSKNFCKKCPLGVDLGEPYKREWNDNALCCGDDDGTWYNGLSVTGLGPEPTVSDGLNNAHDCAKLVSSGEYLCNMHRSDGQSKWYNAVDDPGEIAYIPCISYTGFEAVSDGQRWIGCGNIPAKTDSTHQFDGDFFQEEKRIGFIDGWKHSYFCIAPPTEAGIDTIYECCGTKACKSSSATDPEGGLQTALGYSFNYGSGLSSTYYCTYQSDIDPATGIVFSSELTKSTLWTTDLDLTNKASCESAIDPETELKGGFTWTGKDFYHIQGDNTHNFCCSENDDNQLPYESYNDPGGIGACFSSEYQENQLFVLAENHTYTELYVFNGSIHGCAIDDYAAISNHCSGPSGDCTGYKSYISQEYYNADTNKPYDGSFPAGLRNENNFLLDIKNWPNPAELSQQEILIEDHAYCSLIDFGENDSEEIGEYYCSYEEVWKETEGNKLNHLSFTEWGVGVDEKRAECCKPTECWNGLECISSQHTNPVIPPFNSAINGYRCIFGEWYDSYLKRDWDNVASGWCPQNDQCLLNPSGQYEDYNNPQCINSGVFVGDHYCEGGQWTTRTKFLALQLLDSVKNENKYVLSCGKYQETLNKLDYEVFISVEDYIKNQRQPRSGLQPFDSVNNFCILRYGENDEVAIAVSLNHPINLDDPTNFLNVFEESIACPIETNGFQNCEGSNVYYNSQLNSIIYDKGQLSFVQTPTSILSFFQEMFDFIFGWQPTYNINSDYAFLQDTKDFKKVYVSNQEQIVAVTEKVWPSENKEHIAIKYSGIGADICKSIEIYDDFIGESDYLQCNVSQGTHYVISGLPEGINLWPQLTSKLRPNP